MHAQPAAVLLATLLGLPAAAWGDASVPASGGQGTPPPSAAGFELRGEAQRLTHGHGGPAAHLASASFTVKNPTSRRHRLVFLGVTLHRAHGVGGAWQKPEQLAPRALARDLADSAAATGRTPLLIEPRSEERVHALFTPTSVDSHARYRLVLVLSVDGTRREVEVPLSVWSRWPLHDERSGDRSAAP